MTLLGKILLFFNLAFALLLAAWSFGLYANGIDWSSRNKANEPKGTFAVREERLDELWKGVPGAQVTFLSERRKLLDEESHLAADRIWYDNDLKHLQGIENAGQPVGEISFAIKDDEKTGVRKGQILLDDKGFPKLVQAKDRAGKPLMPLTTYNNEDAKILQSLQEVLKKHEDQIKEANRLTDLIIGDKNRRGLYPRFLDEKAKAADVLAEQKLIRPLLINTVVESEMVLKRRNQLEKRIKELKSIGIASGK